MSKFTEYKNLSLTETAKNIAEFWKTNDTFKKSVEIREGQPEFVFYEGKIFSAVSKHNPENRFSEKPVGTRTDFLWNWALRKNWELPKKISARKSASKNTTKLVKTP